MNNFYKNSDQSKNIKNNKSVSKKSEDSRFKNKSSSICIDKKKDKIDYLSNAPALFSQPDIFVTVQSKPKVRKEQENNIAIAKNDLKINSNNLNLFTEKKKHLPHVEHKDKIQEKSIKHLKIQREIEKHSNESQHNSENVTSKSKDDKAKISEDEKNKSNASNKLRNDNNLNISSDQKINHFQHVEFSKGQNQEESTKDLKLQREIKSPDKNKKNKYKNISSEGKDSDKCERKKKVKQKSIPRDELQYNGKNLRMSSDLKTNGLQHVKLSKDQNQERTKYFKIKSKNEAFVRESQNKYKKLFSEVKDITVNDSENHMREKGEDSSSSIEILSQVKGHKVEDCEKYKGRKFEEVFSKNDTSICMSEASEKSLNANQKEKKFKKSSSDIKNSDSKLIVNIEHGAKRGDNRFLKSNKIASRSSTDKFSESIKNQVISKDLKINTAFRMEDNPSHCAETAVKNADCTLEESPNPSSSSSNLSKESGKTDEIDKKLINISLPLRDALKLVATSKENRGNLSLKRKDQEISASNTKRMKKVASHSGEENLSLKRKDKKISASNSKRTKKVASHSGEVHKSASENLSLRRKHQEIFASNAKRTKKVASHSGKDHSDPVSCERAAEYFQMQPKTGTQGEDFSSSLKILPEVNDYQVEDSDNYNESKYDGVSRNDKSVCMPEASEKSLNANQKKKKFKKSSSDIKNSDSQRIVNIEHGAKGEKLNEKAARSSTDKCSDSNKNQVISKDLKMSTASGIQDNPSHSAETAVKNADSTLEESPNPSSSSSNLSKESGETDESDKNLIHISLPLKDALKLVATSKENAVSKAKSLMKKYESKKKSKNEVKLAFVFPQEDLDPNATVYTRDISMNEMVIAGRSSYQYLTDISSVTPTEVVRLRDIRYDPKYTHIFKQLEADKNKLHSNESDLSLVQNVDCNIDKLHSNESVPSIEHNIDCNVDELHSNESVPSIEHNIDCNVDKLHSNESVLSLEHNIDCNVGELHSNKSVLSLEHNIDCNVDELHVNERALSIEQSINSNIEYEIICKANNEEQNISGINEFCIEDSHEELIVEGGVKNEQLSFDTGNAYLNEYNSTEKININNLISLDSSFNDEGNAMLQTVEMQETAILNSVESNTENSIFSVIPYERNDSLPEVMIVESQNSFDDLSSCIDVADVVLPCTEISDSSRNQISFSLNSVFLDVTNENNQEQSDIEIPITYSPKNEETTDNFVEFISEDSLSTGILNTTLIEVSDMKEIEVVSSEESFNVLKNDIEKNTLLPGTSYERDNHDMSTDNTLNESQLYIKNYIQVINELPKENVIPYNVENQCFNLAKCTEEMKLQQVSSLEANCTDRNAISSDKMR